MPLFFFRKPIPNYKQHTGKGYDTAHNQDYTEWVHVLSSRFKITTAVNQQNPDINNPGIIIPKLNRPWNDGTNCPITRAVKTIFPMSLRIPETRSRCLSFSFNSSKSNEPSNEGQGGNHRACPPFQLAILIQKLKADHRSLIMPKILKSFWQQITFKAIEPAVLESHRQDLWNRVRVLVVAAIF